MPKKYISHPTHCKTCGVELVGTLQVKRTRMDGTVYIQPRCRNCINKTSKSKYHLVYKREVERKPPVHAAVFQPFLCRAW